MTPAVQRAVAVESMRAVVQVEPGRWELRRVRTPMPGPGQVLVRVEGCGLCAAAPGEVDGVGEPGWPGHEGWGEVVGAGDAASARALPAGTRVAMVSSRALAAFDVADVAACVPLPAALAGREVPGEPLARAMNVLARADVAPGQVVAVVGLGLIGAVVAQAAARAGARVIVVSRRTAALARVREHGVFATIHREPGDDDAAARQVLEWTGGDGCARVVEATGEPAGLALAIRLAGWRARLVVAGISVAGPGVRAIDLAAWGERGLELVAAHERRRAVVVAGLRAAVDALCVGAIDPRPWMTRVALDDAPAALARLYRRDAAPGALFAVP